MSDGYVIKGVLTGLTPAEKAHLLAHPWQVPVIKEDADIALAEAANRFSGPGLHNGRGDAFRHCYWSALLARDIGPDDAFAFTTAHEAYSANPAGERSMDLQNNAVGIEIGRGNPEASDAILATLCNAALINGDLVTVPPSPGEEYPY